MKRCPPIPIAAIGLAALLTLVGCDETETGSRLHGEPPAKNHALSYDGSKMIVLRERGPSRYYDVVDTGSSDSRGLLSRSFVSMSWGEDSDTAYAAERGGKIYRLTLGPDGERVKSIALTGPGGIPEHEKPSMFRFPTPFSPFLFARAARGDRRFYRCELDPAEGKADIEARCQVADEDGRRTLRWLTTAEGSLAARIVASASGEHVFQTRTEAGVWRPVFRYTPHYTALTIIGGVQADNTVWALSNRSRDRVALVRLDVATGEEEIFFRHDRFDVEEAMVLFDEAGAGTPKLAVCNPDYQQVAHFDDRIRDAYAALREALGTRSRIDFKSIDLAMTSAVVEVRNADIHRRWYLLDLEEKTSRVLSAGRLTGYDRPAAPSRPVSFAASDGLMLHGYLTLPPHRAGDDPPPMVLMLHGGPWVRDRWPAPTLVRFLGSRGYAVLQLNYRGSAGYSRDFIEAGRGALFGQLQRDVLDAAEWAVAEGYAAPGRVALFGGSFGGLLTLAMLARHPGAFRAGIALNAITDAVGFWKRDWSHDNRRALWREFLASPDLPEAALARISPVNNVHRFDAPVLLLAGTRDRRVPPAHSIELFDLLRAAGKEAALVEYEGAGHNLWSRRAKIREHIAGRLDEFLARHLPAEAG